MVYAKTSKMMKETVLVSAVVILAISGLVHTQNQYEDEILRMCAIKNENLRNCQLNCPQGKLWINGCPVCACREKICEGRCLPGERCTIVRQISMYTTGTDAALCEPGPAPPPATLPSRSLSDNPGTCDFQGPCDVTGYCLRGSVCRKDGKCCRVNYDDNNNNNNNNVGSTSSDTSGYKIPACLQKPSVGHCRALGIQYVYNIRLGKCENMIFGGCSTSENSFPTMERCRETCENPCRKPPAAGRCRASMIRYYFDENTQQCESFEYGGCLGNNNNFMKRLDCDVHCAGLRRGGDGKFPTKNLPQVVKPPQVDTTLATTPEVKTTRQPKKTSQRGFTGNEIGNRRLSLAEQIMAAFRRNQNQNVVDRGNVPVQPGDPNKVPYVPRPTEDAGQVFPVPQATFTVATTEMTTPYVTSGFNNNNNVNSVDYNSNNNNNNNNNNDDNNTNDNDDSGDTLLRALAQRLRSRHDNNNPPKAEMTYQNKPTTPQPPLDNRGFSGPSQQDSYGQSANALLNLLRRHG